MIVHLAKYISKVHNKWYRDYLWLLGCPDVLLVMEQESGDNDDDSSEKEKLPFLKGTNNDEWP